MLHLKKLTHKEIVDRYRSIFRAARMERKIRLKYQSEKLIPLFTFKIDYVRIACSNGLVIP